MKVLVLILHLVSGNNIEISSPRMVQHLINMINNDVDKQKSIYITYNRHETWVNLDHVEYIEKVWKEDDGI